MKIGIRRWGIWAMVVFLISITGAIMVHGRGKQKLSSMPEFPNQKATSWINTKPLSLSDFRGQVVLIEIWTSV